MVRLLRPVGSQTLRNQKGATTQCLRNIRGTPPVRVKPSTITTPSVPRETTLSGIISLKGPATKPFAPTARNLTAKGANSGLRRKREFPPRAGRLHIQDRPYAPEFRYLQPALEGYRQCSVAFRLSPANLTVGSGNACPSPPWQDSIVSTPCSRSTITTGLIPSSR